MVAAIDSSLISRSIDGQMVHAPDEPIPIPASAEVVAISYNASRNTMDLVVQDNSFSVVELGDMPPEWLGMLSSQPALVGAIATLENAIRGDDQYANCWHANFACAALDEGIDVATAQRIADRCVAVVSPPIRREASVASNG